MDILSLKDIISGEIHISDLYKKMYATDASAYREVPLGVVYPKNKDDIVTLVKFAREHKISLIPRGAGTSLAGQVVGSGLVVDVSKYMTDVVSINKDSKEVSVQPGIILEELNSILLKHNLFFGPETSTANRCTIGGMLGNNACGLHSIIYGSTRDFTIEAKAILADGSDVTFGKISSKDFEKKTKLESLEGKIYTQIYNILSNTNTKDRIISNSPKPEIPRRNTGYAIDILANLLPFNSKGEEFNMCKLLAGSEGTLAFVYEITLQAIDPPPKHKGVVCIHLKTLHESFKANLVAIKHNPGAIELMDSKILNLTKDNIEQSRNRFFVQGNPGAILIVEFARDTESELDVACKALIDSMKDANFGYHYPIVKGSDITKVWNLRKAGLGILSTMKGDAKPVSLIEDTAVDPVDLPDYMNDFELLLQKFEVECVFHAHIGTGELHLRPILNLKDKNDITKFREIGKESALLVKKYRGSLSGEHGDGRLRGEFIKIVVGDFNYDIFKDIKKHWDSDNIFNPGKIVDTPSMSSFLRYQNSVDSDFETIYDYSDSSGFIRSIERCNGSGDCRKLDGGTLCPSYKATRDERNSTRARANILREYLINSNKKNPFNHKELYDILDLCLMCKGCKSECPSSVDMAKLKSEFLYQYYKSNRIPLRTRLIAHIAVMHKLGSIAPRIFNFFASNKVTSSFLKSLLGFAAKRSIPTLHKFTLRKYIKSINTNSNNPNVYFFVDEFTNYADADIGVKAIDLLINLGYNVKTVNNDISGRTYISKGLLDRAKKAANANVELFSNIINDSTPLIGIEPSATLSFRDEYPELVSVHNREKALILSKNVMLIEEFISREVDGGRITSEKFTKSKQSILVHGHCQQKAIASTTPLVHMLSLPTNYKVTEIPSGCCGMAGSFGYEKEHFELSNKIGELVLFPDIRKSPEFTIISAPGTSCRQHIKDGTQRDAVHPVEVLYDALESKV